jgi:hypothetical protein
VREAWRLGHGVFTAYTDRVHTAGVEGAARAGPTTPPGATLSYLTVVQEMDEVLTAEQAEVL